MYYIVIINYYNDDDVTPIIMHGCSLRCTRYAAAAAEYMLSSENNERLILWVEGAQTSIWAQALDQINKNLHHKLNLAKKLYITVVAAKRQIEQNSVKINHTVLHHYFYNSQT